jgi:hypothetical protein
LSRQKSFVTCHMACKPRPAALDGSSSQPLALSLTWPVDAVQSVPFAGPSVQCQGSGLILNEVNDLGPEAQSFLRMRLFARAQDDTFTLSVYSSEKFLFFPNLHE